MAELIISLIAVSILGHHIDESKIKKYEMIDDNGIKLLINKKSFVIGLFASPDRLKQIRASRLQSLKENKSTNYIDIDL